MMQDTLIKLIMTQLKETSNMREKTSDFIRKVVNIYTIQLMNKGDIPNHFLDEVMNDVEAEAIEIFRKKTYGYLTLEEYRRHSCRQKDDN